MLIDPAINLVFSRMKSQLSDYKEKLEQAQTDLSAWKFTPDRLEMEGGFTKLLENAQHVNLTAALTVAGFSHLELHCFTLTFEWIMCDCMCQLPWPFQLLAKSCCFNLHCLYMNYLLLKCLSL